MLHLAGTIGRGKDRPFLSLENFKGKLLRLNLKLVYPPVIATSQALSHLDGLITFFEAMPASDLGAYWLEFYGAGGLKPGTR